MTFSHPKQRPGFLLVPIVLLSFGVAPAFAQFGATNAGNIIGQLADRTGVTLPGVTVTIESRALIGTRTVVTGGQGLYRFLGVPTGDYRVTYELDGFTTLVRKDVRVGIGFTATVDVVLGVARLDETVTVVVGSPTIDLMASHIQTRFTGDALEAVPTARNMTALLALTPGVSLDLFDVGGSGAGTEGRYAAYGHGGQNRVVVEGINATQDTIGGFFVDYGSLDDVSIGTVGNGVEMPNPGIWTRVIIGSGGDRFSGNIYLDYAPEDLQSRNLDSEHLAAGIAEDSNRLAGYHDVNVSSGGPIVTGRTWWHGSFRRQENDIRFSPFPGDTTILTRRTHLGGKLTHQLSSRDRLVGFVQAVERATPRGPGSYFVGSPVFPSKDATFETEESTLVWKAEYNRSLGNRGFFEARVGGWSQDQLWVNGAGEVRTEDVVTNVVTGGWLERLRDRDRFQVTSAATVLKDDWLGGTHAFRFGGEVLHETERNRYAPLGTDPVLQLPGAGRPVVVSLYDIPTDSRSGLRTYGAFVNDTWVLDQFTLNLGIRFDRYRSFLPAQVHLAGVFHPVEERFDAVPNLVAFNNLAPRLGVSYNLAGDGRTALKASYGRYYFDPGTNLGAELNPNTQYPFRAYTWNDANGDIAWQPGEEGVLFLQSGGEGTPFVDPDLKNSFTDEAAGWVERELTPSIGLRAGVVWKKAQNGYQTFNVLRPLDVYSVPVVLPDPGPDGMPGTADDSSIQTFQLEDPTAGVPPRNEMINPPGYDASYTSTEVSLSKRETSGWSLAGSFTYTWTTEYGNNYFGNRTGASSRNSVTGVRQNSLLAGLGDSGYPRTPNDRTLHSFTMWTLKTYGTYEPGWGVRLSLSARHQSGQPYGRNLLISLNYGPGLYQVEPIGTRRQDHITIVDLRAEKVFNTESGLRLGVFLDVFNLFNANPATLIQWQTGLTTVNGESRPTFERPILILPPRVARIGFRTNW